MSQDNLTDYGPAIAGEALKRGIITAEMLAAAMKAWSENPSAAFLEILLHSSLLDNQSREKLKAFILQDDSYSAFHQLASEESPKEANEEGPATIDYVKPPQDAYATEVTDPTPNPQDAFETYAPPTQSTNPSFAVSNAIAAKNHRFKIKKQLAKGGLGVVYVAKDGELNREVALKKIRADQTNNQHLREKFYLEAEVTGQLEHPGIVPVYSMGLDASGQPFYAMRFIRGENYQDAIRRFHKREGKNPYAYNSLEFRGLLRRFIDVCNAIHYAHARRVIHRDIKPLNVMIGTYGETLVVDWGMAKMMNDLSTTDSSAVDSSVDRPSHSIGRVQLTGSSTETQMGSFGGTPAYASPEQLKGRIDLLCAQSDIYSLGCMLYELLTGQLPIQKRMDPLSLAEFIQQGNIAGPRSIVKSIPKSLDQICLKAMAPEITNRYATARQLSEDLERWLADERVLAFGDREPPAELAWRLLRKYRSWTTSIAAAIVLIAIIAAIGALLVNRARLNELTAKKAAQTYKSEAVDRYGIARDAIDSLLVRSSESLKDFPATRDLQQQLLQLAAEDYERLSAQNSGDPELEIERVKALVRLADIQHLQSQYDKAHQLYNNAVEELQKIRSHPENSELLQSKIESEIAGVYARMGLAWDHQDQYEKSRESFKRAIEELRRILKQAPSSIPAKQRLASSLALYGNLEARVGDLLHAAELLKESLTLYDDRSIIQDSKITLATIGTQESFGRVLTQLGKTDDAQENFDKAIIDIKKLAEESPGSLDFSTSLASIYISRSLNAKRTGNLEQTITDIESARSIYKALQQAYPDNIQNTEALNISDTDLGLVLFEQGYVKEARSIFEECTRRYEALLSSYPQVKRFSDGLATSLAGLGQTTAEFLDTQEQSNNAYSRSRSIWEQLAATTDKPQFDLAQEPHFYLAKWCVATSNQAQLLQSKGLFAEADTLFLEASSLMTQILENQPNDPEYKNFLAHIYWRCGLNKYDENPAIESNEYFSKAIITWRELVKETSSPEYRFQLANCLLRCPAPAHLDAKEALQLMKGCIDKVPLRRQYLNLAAVAYLKNDDSKTATALLDKIKATPSTWDAFDYCVLAEIQMTNNQKDAAIQSLESAISWVKENRPENLDLKRLIKHVSELISR